MTSAETESEAETDIYAWEHAPIGYVADPGLTYDDIDFDGLESLGIFELRFLANRFGVYEPLSKTQDELIEDIRKLGEIEAR